MPESDYMNERQQAFFKHLLREREAQLRSNAGATAEHLRDNTIIPDMADRATIEEEHALELRTRDRERKLLKKRQVIPSVFLVFLPVPLQRSLWKLSRDANFVRSCTVTNTV